MLILIGAKPTREGQWFAARESHAADSEIGKDRHQTGVLAGAKDAFPFAEFAVAFRNAVAAPPQMLPEGNAPAC